MARGRGREGELAEPGPSPRGEQRGASDEKFGVNAPQISLPKGGGAVSGIGEKFGANPVTGTGSITVPVFTLPGRSGCAPQLSVSYDSGAGNGPFDSAGIYRFRRLPDERTRAYRNILMPKSPTSSYYPAPRTWSLSLSKVR